MKKGLILISVLAALLSKQLFADEIAGGPRVNMLTNELIVPCIKVDDPGGEFDGRYFDVKFEQSGNSFEFISAVEEDAEVCKSSIATALMADQDTSDIYGNLGSNLAGSPGEDLDTLLKQAMADKEAKFYDDLGNNDLDLTPEELANHVLKMIVPILNDYFVSSRLFTEHKFNIFGKEDNHLDPMDFNGKVSARYEKCLGHLFGRCVLGYAGVQAGVYFLRGLASARISDITITKFTSDNDSVGGTGTIALTSGNISGNASAAAWYEFIKPSVSGSLVILGLDPHGAQNVQITLVQDQESGKLVPQLKTLELTSMSTPFKFINLELNGFLGKIFAPILTVVANSIYRIVQVFFDLDGEIGKALIGVTNKGIKEGRDAINKVLKEQWLKEMSNGYEVNLIQDDGKLVSLSQGNGEAKPVNQSN